MSRLRVNKLTNKDNNGAPEFVHGVTVSGVATATKFKGDGSELTSVTTNFNILDSGVPSGTISSLNFGNGISIDSTLNSVATISVDTSNLASLSGATFTDAVTVQGNANAESVKLIGRSSDDRADIQFFENDGSTFIASLSSQLDSLNLFLGSSSGELKITGNQTVFRSEIGTERMRLDSSGLDVSGAISLGSVALPSAGTARIYSRDIDNSLYLQTSSGNRISLLDGSQNSMASFEPTILKFFISNTERMRIDSSGDATFTGTITADAYSFANLTEL